MQDDMNKIFVLNKQVGETPLECINRFKKTHSEYQDIKMTYAGRLDPMASGVLLVLAGNMVYEKDSFLKLPKSYDCVAILGIETDTYDVLGMPSASKLPLTPSWQEGEPAAEKLRTFIGTFSQPYPPYSSKTIHGKQMHTLARTGDLVGLEIPEQIVSVEAISHIRYASITASDLVEYIVQSIHSVTGDFRQAELIEKWKSFSKENATTRMTLMLFSLDVSGGTYIRGIVHALGQKLGIGACILSLKRTKVGDYEILDKTV